MDLHQPLPAPPPWANLPLEILPLIFRHLPVHFILQVGPRLYHGMAFEDQRNALLRCGAAEIAILFGRGHIGREAAEYAVELHNTHEDGLLRGYLSDETVAGWVPVLHAAIENRASNFVILFFLSMGIVDEDLMVFAARVGNVDAVKVLFHHDVSGCCYISGNLRDEVIKRDNVALVKWMWSLRPEVHQTFIFDDIYLWLLECLEHDALECFIWLYHTKATVCYTSIFTAAVVGCADKIARWLIGTCKAPNTSVLDHFQEEVRLALSLRYFDGKCVEWSTEGAKADYDLAEQQLIFVRKFVDILNRNNSFEQCGGRPIVSHVDDSPVRLDC